MQVVLAHGASGNSASMRPFVDALARRGVASTAIDLPKGRAEAAVPAYRAAVDAIGEPLRDVVIGGQSYGGRVASLLAATEPPRGLVLFCYPLHAPGKSGGPLRIEHWPQIACPVLLLSGESDPLARIDLLREHVKQLPDAELVTYPRLGHGLGPVLEDAMERVARFVSRLTTVG
jgi:predicted alpha/beta-hydrolase family hydrolase